MLVALGALLIVKSTDASHQLARTPPMGWMSWQVFRCGVDCVSDPHNCIGEKLYKMHVHAMVADGYAAAGYDTIHIDDCWEGRHPPRDASGKLYVNASRFPSGFGGANGLAAYTHSRGMKFGIYSDEGTMTCGRYPGSKGTEELDAKTFAEWGVDYLKEDGCNDKVSDYPRGYAAMGAALQQTGRDIIYSCSWPAYLGDNETAKPYAEMTAAGCTLWRNWHDIQCSWDSLSSIIDHWGDYSSELIAVAGPGHWNDPDMLLIGANQSGTQSPCLSEAEERTQMAVWSLTASPLIMGNDARSIRPSSAKILLNARAIAIDQDPLGQPGGLVRGQTSASAHQLWARPLSGGAVAVGLYNKGVHFTPPPIPPSPCAKWVHNATGYYEASGGSKGNVGTFRNISVAEAQAACCANPRCAGFSYRVRDGSGYYKRDATAGFVPASGYEGYARPSQVPPPMGPAAPANITVTFAAVGLGDKGKIRVRDVWSGAVYGAFDQAFTVSVDYHDTAFLHLAPVSARMSAAA